MMSPKPRKRRKTVEYIIEFILVVLGISLAFWLGERAEHNKEDRLQHEYLEALLLDLSEDLDLIDYIMVLNQGRSDLLKSVEDSSINGTGNLDDTAEILTDLADLDLFYPNDFTYISLKQSGDFKILKSQEIRKVLVKLYSSYESIDKEQTNLVNSLDNNFFPSFYQNYEVLRSRIINRNYFKSPELLNYVGLTRKKLNTISIYFDRSKNLAEQVTSLIQKELDR